MTRTIADLGHTHVESEAFPSANAGPDSFVSFQVEVTETALTLQCQQDMLGIACALELYRRANGDLPASLGALVPEYIAKLHDDPVSGEAYRYERVEEKNYRLWAVGMDGLDDGGIYDSEERYSDQADIVWPLSYGIY